MDAKERIIELIDQGKITAEDGTRLLEAIKEQSEGHKPKSSTKKWVFLGIGGGLAAIVVFIAIGGWAVSYLWNSALVPLFHWPAIGFWMALRITLLIAIVGGLLGFSRGFRFNHKHD